MAYLDDNTATVRIVTEQDGSGIEDTKSDLNSLAKTSESTDGKLTSFTDNFRDGLDKVAKVSAIAGAGITLFAKTSVDKLTDTVKASKDLGRQTGMTTEDASRLVAAMGRVGVSSDTASIAFRTLSKIIADSREDTGDMSNRLNAMSVATKNADGTARGFSDILLDVSDRFKSMPDGAEKTALALELFGRSGTTMIKTLNGGSQALKDLEEQADKMGLTLTTENIATVEAYIKSQKDLAAQTESLQMSVGQLTAPVLTDFNMMLNQSLNALIGVDGPLRDVTVGFLAFGGPILGATAGVAEFASNVAGAIPLVKSLGAVVASPIVMPAITVAAALASLALVANAVGSVINAINAMNDAAEAQRQLAQTNARLNDAASMAYQNGDIAKGDKLRSIAKNNNTSTPNYFDAAMQSVFSVDGWKSAFGFSTGGYTGAGPVDQVKGVVHAGEYVLRQDEVDQRTGMPKASVMQSGGQSITNHFNFEQLVLSTPEAVREFFTVSDYDTQMVGMGLSPNRGAS